MTQEHPSLPSQQVIAPPRPAHATDRYDGPTLLYRLFDTDDHLLYIGITCNPPQRWERHRSTKSWWKRVVRKEMTAYPDRSAALTAEAEAIRTERPVHNIHGNPGVKRMHVHLVLDSDQAAKVRALAEQMGGSSNNRVFLALLEAATIPRPGASEPGEGQ